MKVGYFSCDILILRGTRRSGSKILSTFFILSCFILIGSSPDCRIIVKIAFSRGEHFLVILLISLFVIFLLFMVSTLPSDWVTFHYD